MTGGSVDASWFLTVYLKPFLHDCASCAIDTAPIGHPIQPGVQASVQSAPCPRTSIPAAPPPLPARPAPRPQSNYVTIADHSKYRYLISADGFTASARFGKLLGINSATLKEDSQWIEYYYRWVGRLGLYPLQIGRWVGTGRWVAACAQRTASG